MQILFATDEIMAEANSFARMVAKYGERKARKIRQRLDEMNAAMDLYELARLPAIGCYCLEDNRSCVGLLTLKPSILVFDVAKNFDAPAIFSPAVWEKVVIVEIVSLDREKK